MKIVSKKMLYKIMIGFFFLLLVIPNVGLLREQKNINHVAEMENRTINPLPRAKAMTAKFFSELEGWYNDRLLGRRDMIRSWAQWNGRVFNILISKNVVRGKDGYLFSPTNMSTNLVDAKEKFATIKKIQEQCAKRNIRFVFVLTPNSEMVLSDLFNEKFPRINLPMVENNIAIEMDKLNIEHCFVGADLVAMPLAERKNMYYEGDGHWTKIGGYYASKKLLKQLGYDKKINLPVKKIEFQTTEGGYFRDAGLPMVPSTHYYLWSEDFADKHYLFDNRDEDHSSAVLTDNLGEYGTRGEDILVNDKASSKVNLLMLGDSFSFAMKPYLLQDINTIVYSHSRDIHNPKKKIDIEYMLDKYKPDVVVLQKMEALFHWENYHETFGNIAVYKRK